MTILMLKIYICLILFFAIGLLTTNAYAATLIISLVDVDQAIAHNFQAEVRTITQPFNVDGQVQYSSIDPGSYSIDIQNKNNDSVGFSVVNSGTGDCDGSLDNAQDIDTCEISLNGDNNNNMGTGSTNTTEKPPAKFNVKTIISKECLSSSPCSTIKEKDIHEIVYVFSSTNNQHYKVSSFPGSNLSRHLIFDNDYDFKYGPIQIEVDANQKVIPSISLDFKTVLIDIEYNSCSTYLDAGEEVNCLVTVKPFNFTKLQSNSTM